MLFNIVSNITNGAGLEQDTILFKTVLQEAGHEVITTMFNDDFAPLRDVDINVFIEVVDPKWVSRAKQNWIIPNSEWWFPVWDPILPDIDLVLCKTQHCYDIWRHKVEPHKAYFLGWRARDMLLPGVKQEKVFFHCAGKSLTKNTAVVIEAWKKHQLPYSLIINAARQEVMQGIDMNGAPKSVTVRERLSEHELRQIMNESLFMLMPSKQEGYGMAIHEGLSCNAIVLTTDAPSMNQIQGIDPRMLIPVQNTFQRLITHFYEVSADGIADVVRRAMSLTDEEVQGVSRTARASYIHGIEQFQHRFATLMNKIKEPVNAG